MQLPTSQFGVIPGVDPLLHPLNGSAALPLLSFRASAATGRLLFGATGRFPGLAGARRLSCGGSPFFQMPGYVTFFVVSGCLSEGFSVFCCSLPFLVHVV